MKKEKVKCVIWDLDKTLWEGILSEGDNIVPRQNIAHIIQTLDSRGIIQSIASKNEFAPAMSKLKELSLSEYFLFPQINWHAKSASVAHIKTKLNIGYNSLLFIDDNIFERDEVQSVHPEVRCWDVDRIATMLDCDELMPRFITPETGSRRSMYLQDMEREEEEKAIGNNHQFLEGLNMRFSIAAATKNDLARVEELTVRTNQLNATGYTYSYEELESFLSSPAHRLLVCSLDDKYGTYGKIGVALLEQHPEGWVINLLLMSCRVISRGVGAGLLSYLVNEARKENKKLFARFSHTDKNRVMYITYKFAGFEIAEKINDKEELLEYRGNADAVIPAYLNLSFACAANDAQYQPG